MKQWSAPASKLNKPSTSPSAVRTFRPATPADVRHIVRLLIPLYSKQGGVYEIPLDLDSMISTVITTIHNGICLVGPTACAGALIVPFPWNYHARIGSVIFWNYSKPSGVRVFGAILEALRDAGATHINAASHFPHNTIARHYKRFGLRPCEIQHSFPVADMNTTPFTFQKGAH